MKEARGRFSCFLKKKGDIVDQDIKISLFGMEDYDRAYELWQIVLRVCGKK